MLGLALGMAGEPFPGQLHYSTKVKMRQLPDICVRKVFWAVLDAGSEGEGISESKTCVWPLSAAEEASRRLGLLGGVTLCL